MALGLVVYLYNTIDTFGSCFYFGRNYGNGCNHLWGFEELGIRLTHTATITYSIVPRRIRRGPFFQAVLFAQDAFYVTVQYNTYS